MDKVKLRRACLAHNAWRNLLYGTETMAALCRQDKKMGDGEVFANNTKLLAPRRVD